MININIYSDLELNKSFLTLKKYSKKYAIKRKKEGKCEGAFPLFASGGW